MKAPVDWLKDYLAEPLSTKAMAEALEAGGIEVEQILYAPKLDEQIIVAEVKKVMQHPQADKLKMAEIATGQSQITLVCGAPNLEIGQKVALAQVGAKLPDGTKIKVAEIRGQTSRGMLCSPRELGLGDDHSGILVLDPQAKLGQPVAKVLSTSDVIDLTTQANRFDLLSLTGLAREISAQTKVALKLPPESQTTDFQVGPKVQIEAKTAVKRYLLAQLKLDLSHGTAPQAKSRLASTGMRSINLGVDITNYTMWETGQPLHAFDAKKVKLPITVRWAKAGEQLVTLDDVKRQLTTSDLVIADQTGPIALAGVMGGQGSQVTAKTTEIFLESASFDPVVVRKMAQRHGLRSEASARFERGLPAKLAEVGLARAIYSYEQAAAAKVLGLTDLGSQTETQLTISLDPDHVAKVLSLAVSAKDLAKVLPRFGFEVELATSEVLVKVPWWRPDVKLAEDLAEEYIRLVGFDQVVARLPKWQPDQVQADQYWPRLWQLKAILKGLGLFEVMTYSFVAKEQLDHFGYELSRHLKLKNPLSSEQAYLRQNLLPSLLAALVRNQGYAPLVGLYETAQVFLPTKPGKQPLEPQQLGILIKQPENAYFSLKAALDAIAAAFKVDLRIQPEAQIEFLANVSALIKHQTKTLGRIGQIHPRYLSDFRGQASLGYLELDIAALFAASTQARYQPINRFPSLYRDLAIVVDQDLLWQDVARVIQASQLAQPRFLSDYYGPELESGKKSLALRLEMSSLDGTLSDQEANRRLEQITQLLARHFGAKPREASA